MKILSREKTLNLVLKEPNKYKVIVIYESMNSNVEQIIKNCKEFYAIQMKDSTLIETVGGPTKEIIIEALEKDREVEFDIVSCAAGVSRSSALAFLIQCQRTNANDALNLMDIKHHFPNELIMQYGTEIMPDIINEVKEVYIKLSREKNWPINLVTKYFR